MPPKILAVAMQKGGVGKTTTAVNLAAAAAGHLGLSTYILDFDGQCNATKGITGSACQEGPTLETVMRGEATIAEAAVPSPHGDPLRVVPGSKGFSDFELEIAEQGKWKLAARELPRLLREGIPADADLLVLDTPPSLGLWLQVALGMADEVLVVAKAEEYSLDGMEDLLATVAAVQRGTNARLRIRAVLLNNVREATNEHAAFMKSFTEIFGDRVLQPSLPQRTAIPTAQRKSLPVEHLNDKGAQDVRKFYRTLARRLFLDEPETVIPGGADAGTTVAA